MGDVGAGVLIAPDLVLTCSHVVPHDSVDVTLVHVGSTVAASVEFRDDDGDLAVLRLATPVSAVCAPLRAPTALSDHTYLVQGFAGGNHTESRGRLGGRVGPGWVQLEHTSGHRIDRGFSGAPVWDDTLQAVVGIVVTAHKAVGGGNLIPVEEIVRLWPSAALYTGWRVDLDDAFDTHWLPRARGVEPHEPTDVWHFVGRHRALTELAFYLQGPADGRVRAVVGSPGSGKSAVIARTVVLADRAGRPLVPTNSLPPEVALPPVGSVTVAVHARGKTLMDVVRAIADGADVEAADQTELLQRCGPISVVVDALDEAAGDAPMAIATMLNRLATHSERHVVVGTRVGARGSSSNALLTRLGNPVVLDLDSEGYLDHQDVITYAEHRVDDPARAAAIARHAGGNFLIAQLACLTDSERLPTSVGAAVDDYLTVRFDRPRVVRDLLLPLAYAEGSGLPEGPLWLALANTLGATDYTAHDLREVLTSAASYLVERSGGTFRLFHQALDDTFRAERPGLDQVVYETLRGQVTGWEDAPEYVRAHLTQHAVTAGRLDDLVEDLDFMLTADPERVVPHLAHVTSERAVAVRRTYRRALHSFEDGDRAHRAACFALKARQSGFGGLADEVTGPVAWHAAVLAQRPEDGYQVLARIPQHTRVGMWLDRRGNPAVLISGVGSAVLLRYQDYRLVEVDRLADASVPYFTVIAPEILPDGREVALSSTLDGALARWSFTDRLRLTGMTSLDEVQYVSDVDTTTTPDGRLLAGVADGSSVWVVDFTDDVPVVLHRVRFEGLSPSRACAITAEGDVVHLACAGAFGVWFADVTANGVVRNAAVHLTKEVSTIIRFAATASGPVLLVGFTNRPPGLVERVDGVPFPVAAVGTTTTSPPNTATKPGLATGVLADGRTIAVTFGVFGGGELYEVGAEVVPLGGPLAVSRAIDGSLAIGDGPSGVPVVLTRTKDRVQMWDVDRPAPPADVPPDIPDNAHNPRFLRGDGTEVVAVHWRNDEVRVTTVTDHVMPPVEVAVRGDIRAVAHADNRPVITLHRAAGTIEVWAHTPRGLRRSRPAITPAKLRRPGSHEAVDDTGSAVVVWDSDDELTWWTWDGGGWRPTTDRIDRDPHQSQRPRLYRLRDEPRLLVTGSAAFIARPGERLANLGGDCGTEAAIGYDAAEPVAALRTDDRISLLSLAADRFTAWSRPWSHGFAGNGWFHVDLAFPAAGRALVAAGSLEGRVRVWACHRGGTARELASIDLETGLEGLIWTRDHKLVVWYVDGVLKLDFG
ncbi:hypothetical protein ALI22I_26065 [Saccharothrix sp. ALI-22-I]|nr:hypothetical protein ALI22I_26065 [Saccharothrix sp. ALI-22-I]